MCLAFLCKEMVVRSDFVKSHFVDHILQQILCVYVCVYSSKIK